MKFESTAKALEWLLRHRLGARQPISALNRVYQRFDDAQVAACDIEAILVRFPVRQQSALFNLVLTGQGNPFLGATMARFKRALADAGYLKETITEASLEPSQRIAA